MSAFDTEKQSNYPPERVRGLVPFKPGQSGNPGGQQKGVVYVSEAYKRFGRMTVEELEALDRRKQLSVVEAGVVNMLLRAADTSDWQAAHAALKEITDRIEGKPEQKKTITQNSTNLEIRLEYSIADVLEAARKLNLPVDAEMARVLVEQVAGIGEA